MTEGIRCCCHSSLPERVFCLFGRCAISLPKKALTSEHRRCLILPWPSLPQNSPSMKIREDTFKFLAQISKLKPGLNKHPRKIFQSLQKISIWIKVGYLTWSGSLSAPALLVFCDSFTSFRHQNDVLLVVGARALSTALKLPGTENNFISQRKTILWCVQSAVWSTQYGGVSLFYSEVCLTLKPWLVLI